MVRGKSNTHTHTHIYSPDFKIFEDTNRLLFTRRRRVENISIEKRRKKKKIIPIYLCIFVTNLSGTQKSSFSEKAPVATPLILPFTLAIIALVR